MSDFLDFVYAHQLGFQIAFFLLCGWAIYLIWLRPYLRTRPGFKDFYDVTDSTYASIKLRFAGIKGHLIGGLAQGAALVVLLHDQVLPYATGVDWTPISQYIPAWAFPLITFGGFWLVGQCRIWAEQRAAERAALLLPPDAPL